MTTSNGCSWVVCRGPVARRKALGLMSTTLLPVSGRAVSLVPRVVPGQAPCRLSGGCAAVLRQACPTDRSASIRRLSGAAVEHKVGGLLQAPLRRPEGSVALSRPLHSSRRDLKSSLDRMRPERRHLQVEGLQARRSRALSGDDACHPRVHPPLSHARAARGLPPHPLYGLLASGQRAENIARARELLMPPIIPVDAIKAISPDAAEPEPQTTNLCPCCGGRMVIVERFDRPATPRYGSRPRQRSGSTPHDPITANQQSLQLLLAGFHRPPQPSSHLSSQFT